MRITFFEPLRNYALIFAFAFAFWTSASFCLGATEKAPIRTTTTLVTQLGDRLPGHWIASDRFETIAWQVPGFVQPFQIEKGQLASIQIQHESKVPQIAGTYRCELVGGDVMYGNPLSLNQVELVFEVPGSGQLKIERCHLRKLSPWNDTGQEVDTTLQTLDDWKGKHLAWKEAVGRITAVEDHAELETSLRLGEKSQISIRFGWEGKEGSPDFRIDFGCSEWDSGLRLETWQNRLAFVAESSDAADVLLVTKTVNRPGELLLNIFINTDEETILVATDDGKTLGEFHWNQKFHNNFRILARKKGLHFYHATVTGCNRRSAD